MTMHSEMRQGYKILLTLSFLTVILNEPFSQGYELHMLEHYGLHRYSA